MLIPAWRNSFNFVKQTYTANPYILPDCIVLTK